MPHETQDLRVQRQRRPSAPQANRDGCAADADALRAVFQIGA
jgi:hypothetical protein